MEVPKEDLASNEERLPPATQCEKSTRNAPCDGRKQTCTAVASSGAHHVRLDVGGVRYTTLLSTLCKHPDSMLSTMFRGISEQVNGAPAIGLTRDNDGTYIIDRDGPSFRHVLNYLRHEGPGSFLPPLDDSERLLLASEADYFLLPGLARECLLPPKIRTAPKNMSDADLRNRNFKGFDLSGCDLSNSDLSGADLRDCDLRGANLSNTTLAQTLLQDARMDGTKLAGATGTPGDMGAEFDTNLFSGTRLLVQTESALAVGAFDGWTDSETQFFRVRFDEHDDWDDCFEQANVVRLAGSKIPW